VGDAVVINKDYSNKSGGCSSRKLENQLLDKGNAVIN